MTQTTETLKGIKPEEAQKSLWQLDFQELKTILSDSQHQPLDQDRVDFLIEKAQKGHDDDQRLGKAVMPHFYVIQQLQGCNDSLFTNFLGTLRNRIEQKIILEKQESPPS